MTLDRSLLARYFDQIGELGGGDLFLDDMTARDAIRAVSDTGSAPRGAVAENAPARRVRDSATKRRRPEAARPEPPAPVPYADAPPGAAAATLRVLAERAAGCTLCRLHEGRRNVVFGEGSVQADLVVVGEAPGSEEDRTGRPFVGRAGRMLDLLLLTAGFPRDEVYICNVLKCRPPNNRDPMADEVEQCTTAHLHAQLDAVAPRALIAVGRFAAQVLAGSEAPIGRLRGRVHSYRGTPLVVTYHPAYLLRSPHMSRAAWQDFQLVRKVIDEHEA